MRPGTSWARHSVTELIAAWYRDGFSRFKPLTAALAGYEEQRNAGAMNDYRENLNMAQFKPPRPEVLAIRAGVRGDQEDTTTSSWLSKA